MFHHYFTTVTYRRAHKDGIKIVIHRCGYKCYNGVFVEAIELLTSRFVLEKVA